MARNTKGLYVSYNTLILVCIILFSIGVYMYKPQVQAPIYVQPKAPEVNVQVQSSSGDDRFARAPKPERDWMASPDLSSLVPAQMNLPTIPTRGIPEKYQQMGILRLDDGGILPLYGRPTASRSDRFQYYSRTDTYNPVQMPVRHKNRDCVDDIGCEELFDGDTVKMAATGQTGSVTLYRFSGPTYVPL